MYTIDLHTHSLLSHDGGINESEYLNLQEKINYIAITDHNEVDFALHMNQKYGKSFIVGEEIMTQDGEIIGLFLKKKIEKGLTIEDSIQKIKDQNGVVYIPHPFEKIRKGIQLVTLKKIIKDVDVIENFNARAVFFQKTEEQNEFLRTSNISFAASSDAHCKWGAGSAYSFISEVPTEKNLVKLLFDAKLNTHFAPFFSLLCPKINSMKHLLKKDDYMQKK